MHHKQAGTPGASVSRSVDLSLLIFLTKMRTSSQFTKIGVPLIVVSFLIAVAIILAIALSKAVKEPTTKGKFISPGTGFDLAEFHWVH